MTPMQEGVVSEIPDQLAHRAAICQSWDEFLEAVDRRFQPQPDRSLLLEVAALCRELDGQAGTPPARHLDWGPIVFTGQQAYVDYRLGQLAKIDAIERLGRLGFSALVEYDTCGSDRLSSRTDFPRLGSGADERLTLRFHACGHRYGRRDLRFVPPPDAPTLERIRSDLRGTITLTRRRVAGFNASTARERLDEVWADWSFAREAAAHAADFNILWTARTLRRLGFTLPLVPLSRLWDAPSMTAAIVRTLVAFVRDNDRFVHVANEAIRLAAGTSGMSPRPAGHLPLTMTDRVTGIRFGLRIRWRGPDAVVEGTGKVPFTHVLGPAGTDELMGFLDAYRGLCTPNVFAPLFLFAAGVCGIVSGRGAIRYSLVVAHVAQQLLGVAHAPNLLCAGEVRMEDPFGQARVVAGASPAEVEPTLLARLLAVGPEAVRREVGAVWR